MTDQAPDLRPALFAAQADLPAEPRGMENGVPLGPVVIAASDAGSTERLANWTGRVSRQPV